MSVAGREKNRALLFQGAGGCGRRPLDDRIPLLHPCPKRREAACFYSAATTCASASLSG